MYIRNIAMLVSVYPPVRVQSACGSSSSSVYDLAQGFAPRPLVQQPAGQLSWLHACGFLEHRAAPLGLGKGGAPWPSAQ